MTTNLHRLQISLPRRQMEFLTRRARREGVSVAELIRRLVDNESQATELGPIDPDSALSFAGIVAAEAPLIEGRPVSENVDLYLIEAGLSQRTPQRASARLPRKRSRG